MQGIPLGDDPNLLVGPQHFSDAGVYRIADGLALVQSVDFFPPLVDDPFVFGQIAAANAMGDVYAMGGRPITALNIVAFPDEELGLDVLQEILRGGGERVTAAQAVIVGGHSVRGAEITYGLAVTGLVDPARMMTNRGARPGDVLVLTKALGTGFITTALKRDACPDDALAAAVASMVETNDRAAAAAVAAGVEGATDVTGFGLGGHAMEMAKASDVTITLELAHLPILPGAPQLAADGHLTRANPTNRAFVETSCRFKSADAERTAFLFDPQTSGGLLLAAPRDGADALLRRMRDDGLTAAAIIGSVSEHEGVDLVVV